MVRQAGKEALRAYGWLAETPAGFRDAVLTRSSRMVFERDQWLYHPDETGGGLWGIADGGVHLQLTQGTEGPSLALYASVGFWTGEGSLVAGIPRVIGLRATRQTLTYELSRQAFLSIAAEDPEAWRWVALLSVHHTIGILGLLQDLKIRVPEERVIAVLLRMSNTSWGGPPCWEDGQVEIEFSQEALSEHCNVSRSLLATVLGHLKERELIKVGYRRIMIVNLEGLRGMLGPAA